MQRIFRRHSFKAAASTFTKIFEKEKSNRTLIPNLPYMDREEES